MVLKFYLKFILILCLNRIEIWMCEISMHERKKELSRIWTLFVEQAWFTELNFKTYTIYEYFSYVEQFLNEIGIILKFWFYY